MSFPVGISRQGLRAKIGILDLRRVAASWRALLRGRPSPEKNDDIALSLVTESTSAEFPPGQRAVRTRWRLYLFLPLAGFAALAAAFASRIGLNPSLVPSPLIGKPVPEFSLPPVQGRQLGLASANLKGEVSLVNVFASWCVACRYEHPFFMRLKADGAVPIHGLNYKDKPADAAKWLDTMGDPYTRTGADLNGRVGIDWGVYGVPETFVVDARGIIAYKQIGPVNQQILEQTILPLVRKLQAQAASSHADR